MTLWLSTIGGNSGYLRLKFGSPRVSSLSSRSVQLHLKAIRTENDPLATLVEQGRGTKADLYMLTVPDDIRAAAEDKSWRKGKIHALRPVFRELGIPVALVYEALKHSPAALRSVDLVRVTSLSRTVVTEALETLAAWNPATRSQTLEWEIVATTSLKELAEYSGVFEAMARQLRKYAQDRIIWREWLSKRAHTVAELLSPTDVYPWHIYEGPPEEWTLSHMAFSQVS